MENLKESLPLVVIPPYTVKKNYDQTHSISDSGSGLDSKISQSHDQRDNNSECQCYSPCKSESDSDSEISESPDERDNNSECQCFSPWNSRKDHNFEDTFDAKLRSSSLIQKVRDASFHTSKPLPAKKKMEEQLDQAMSRLSSTSSLDPTVELNDTLRYNSEEKEMQKKLEMSNARRCRKLQRKVEINSMRNFSLSHKVNESSLIKASPRLKSNSVKISEIKDMINKCSESSGVFEAQDTANKIGSTVEVSFDPLAVVAEKENIEIAPRNIIEPPEGEDTRVKPSEIHRISKEQNDKVLTGSTSVVPFNSLVLVSRKEGIEIAPKNCNNVEKIFMWSSSSNSLSSFTRVTLPTVPSSVESNQTLLTNASPILFDISIASTKITDKRVESGEILRISKEPNDIVLTGSTSVASFNLPVVVSEKKGTEISDICNSVKDKNSSPEINDSSRSIKFQKQLKVTKSQISSLATRIVSSVIGKSKVSSRSRYNKSYSMWPASNKGKI